MDVALVAIISSIAGLFNFAILRYKVANGKKLDAFIDFLTLLALSYAFSNSTGGMIIATCTSALISVYLIFKPIELEFGNIKEFRNKYSHIAKRVTRLLFSSLILGLIAYVLMHFKII